MADFDFDQYGEPRDVMAERAVVGGLLALDGPIPEGADLTPDLFWLPAHRAVAGACLNLAAAGKPTDPVTVRAELLRAGERGPNVDPVALFGMMQDGCLSAQIGHHARSLRELAARRDVMMHARRALQHAASPGTDPYEVAAHLSVAAAALSDSGDPARPARTVDAEDFLAQPDAYDWLVPGLLERGDRLLITGGEGSGKASCVGSSQSPPPPAHTRSRAGMWNPAGSFWSTLRTVSVTFAGPYGTCGATRSTSNVRWGEGCSPSNPAHPVSTSPVPMTLHGSVVCVTRSDRSSS